MASTIYSILITKRAITYQDQDEALNEQEICLPYFTSSLGWNLLLRKTGSFSTSLKKKDTGENMIMT